MKVDLAVLGDAEQRPAATQVRRHQRTCVFAVVAAFSIWESRGVSAHNSTSSRPYYSSTAVFRPTCYARGHRDRRSQRRYTLFGGGNSSNEDRCEFAADSSLTCMMAGLIS